MSLRCQHQTTASESVVSQLGTTAVRFESASHYQLYTEMKQSFNLLSLGFFIFCNLNLTVNALMSESKAFMSGKVMRILLVHVSICTN